MQEHIVHELRALIIEDGDCQLQVFGRLLQQAGFTTAVAKNAQTTRALLQDSAFVFILCDLSLGNEESGLDLIREIRRMPGYDRVEIMAFSADTSTRLLEDAIDAGADDAYSKFIAAKILEKRFTRIERKMELLKIEALSIEASIRSSKTAGRPSKYDRLAKNVKAMFKQK
jgi:two-component system response regulator RegA